jgi:serine/threonine protein kinase
MPSSCQPTCFVEALGGDNKVPGDDQNRSSEHTQPDCDGVDLSLLRQRIIVHLLRQVSMPPSKLFSSFSQLLQCGVLTYDVVSEMTGGERCKSLPPAIQDSVSSSGGSFASLQLDEVCPALPQPSVGQDAGGAATAMPDILGSPSRFEQDFDRLELLGRGAFGDVWRCRHRLDGQEYAVKMIEYRTTIAEAAEVERRVLREAQTWASLNHPNVVRYHNAWVEVDWQSLGQQKEQASHQLTLQAGKNEVVSVENSVSFGFSEQSDEASEGGVLFIDLEAENKTSSSLVKPQIEEPQTPQELDVVAKPLAAIKPQFHYKATLYIQTELCSRNTLASWISERNAAVSSNRTSYKELKMWAGQAVAIFHQLATALAALHKHNIAHRDLKPANIFFGLDGTVRVGDFGLAKFMSSSDGTLAIKETVTDSPKDTSSLHTRSIGTPSYASPEQLADPTYGVQTDIYSLGMILAELLCPVNTQMERANLFQDLRHGRGVPTATASTFPLASSLVVAMTHRDAEQRPSAKDLLKVHRDIVLEVQNRFRASDQLASGNQEVEEAFPVPAMKPSKLSSPHLRLSARRNRQRVVSDCACSTVRGRTTYRQLHGRVH